MTKFSDIANRVTFTENGALAFSSFENPVMDFMFLAGNPKANSNEVYSILQEIMKQESDYTTIESLVLFMRDRTNGFGVRDNTRKVLSKLHYDGYDISRIIKLLPLVGRWDDVVWLAYHTNKDTSSLCLEMIKSQFAQDMQYIDELINVSLLGKWLPSINASSQKTKDMAKFIAKSLGVSHKDYRKILSQLRRKIDVVERKLSSKQFKEIHYPSVPSLAMFKYKKAFERNDNVRFAKYLADVIAGKAKMNTGMLPIQQLVNRRHELGKDLFNKLWSQLDVGFIDDNILPVVDVSYSMLLVKIGGGTLKDLSVALGVLAAERMKGDFKDKVVIFSNQARYLSLEDCETPFDKIEKVYNDADCSNTNIVGVFSHVLSLAKEFSVKDEHMPKRMLLLSDMQFDYIESWKNGCPQFPISHAKKLYKEAGYTFPEMIYWNMHSELCAPERRDDNVISLSGYNHRLLELLEHRTVDSLLNSIKKKYKAFLC